MTRGLLRSELLKVTSVRATYALAAGCLLYVALDVVALVFASGQPGVPALSDPATVRTVFASSGAASALVLVIGVLGMTTEFRHQTATPTFLATPRRGRVLAAKLTVHAFVGLVVGIACALVVVGLAYGALSFRDHATLPAGTVLQIQGGTMLGYAIYAALGVCVGALVRNQIAATVGALLWTVLVESLTVALLPSVGRWLPGGAFAGILQSTPLRGGDYLAVWAAALVLAGYGVAFAAVATRTTLRRDVT